MTPEGNKTQSGEEGNHFLSLQNICGKETKTLIVTLEKPIPWRWNVNLHYAS